MKLFSSLEQIFKYRIMSNDQIPQYMKKVASIGKFDQPKVNAVITELLVRVAELEEKVQFNEERTPSNAREKAMLRALEIEKEEDIEEKQKTLEYVPTPKEALSWQEVLTKAKELKVFKPGLKRTELESLIASKTVVE